MDNFPTDYVQEIVETCLFNRKSLRFRIISNSMFPCIKPGDLILVRQAEANELHPGKVVLIRKENSWLVHRILHISKNNHPQEILTKGDNNPVVDPIYRNLSKIGIVVGLFRDDNWIDFTCIRLRIGGRFIVFLSIVQMLIVNYRNRIITALFKRFLRLLNFISARLFFGSLR
jgi:signal peptidase I